MSSVRQREPMLRDDPTLPSDLRAAFAAYADVAPSARAQDALFASLEQSLTKAPGVPSRFSRVGFWLVGLALVGVMAAGLSWRAWPHAVHGTPNAKAPVSPPAAATTVAPKPIAKPVQPVASAVASAAPPAIARPAERRRVEPRAKAPLLLDPTAELALLTRAKRMLPNNAAAALALTGEHERKFSSGTFAQEREVIAIEALVRTQDKQAAARRAAAFRAAYPHSTHLERLRVVLAEP